MFTGMFKTRRGCSSRLMIDEFVSEIKKKKNLSSLPDDFVRRLVEDFLGKYPLLKKSLESHPKPLRSRNFKLLLKEVRKQLHEIYGVFIIGNKDLKILEEHLKGSGKLDETALQMHMKLLSMHKSSAERLDFYSEVYEKIFSYTGKPKSILDLACGLNPLSFPWMGLKSVKYFAYELTTEDSRFIQNYFGIMKPFGLDGEAFAADIINLKSLPKADVCFLFKALDSLESLKRNYSEELLKKIPSKFIVVSFPTMSIGGRNPIKQRGWFFRMMRSLGMEAETFEIENEMFYMIKR